MTKQKTGETRSAYLNRVRNWMSKAYNAGRVVDNACYGYCHPSHTAARVMLDAQHKFEDLCSFGIEGWCDECGKHGINYLNMGDTYELTIMFDSKTERFTVGTWGDTYERWERTNAHKD